MPLKDNSLVEDIKDRCNIVEVVGRVVPLKRAGSNFKGCCPFHNEKTPSFVVSEQKQIFTCFGCGATGDVIEFTKRYNNLDFMGACEKLAGEYGIEIRRGGAEGAIGGSGKKDLLYRINRDAAAFFFRALYKGPNDGRSYMQERGIETDILKKFGIGYADEDWTSLYDHLKSKGYAEKDLLALGLISEKNGKYYDKFRNRVIFPIINTSGKVIGFGGRIIGQGEPKYLNSPESPIFLKKNNLYGLNLTREDISREDRAILVEGYMDVVSLYQSGVRNVSASLGTALTENQSKLLKRYTRNVVLSYDSDSAGRNAALRGIEILYAQECRVKVLHVTDGKDPDEFVKKNGRLAYLELIDKATPYADYKLDAIKRRIPEEDISGRVQFMEEAAKVIKQLSPIEQDIYIKKIASEEGFSEGALRQQVAGVKPEAAVENRREIGGTKTGGGEKISNLEKMLIKLLLTDAKYYEKISLHSDVFRSEEGRAVYESISEQLKSLSDNEIFDYKRLADSLDVEFVGVLNDINENTKLGVSPEQAFNDCMKDIEKRALRRRLAELDMMLSLADEEENGGQIVEINKEYMEIIKLLKEI